MASSHCTSGRQLAVLSGTSTSSVAGYTIAPYFLISGFVSTMVVTCTDLRVRLWQRTRRVAGNVPTPALLAGRWIKTFVGDDVEAVLTPRTDAACGRS
jgi:hypothetical protein